MKQMNNIIYFCRKAFKNLQSSWDFNKYQDIKLDEKKIANGDTFDTADGSYTIKTDDGLSYIFGGDVFFFNSSGFYGDQIRKHGVCSRSEGK